MQVRLPGFSAVQAGGSSSRCFWRFEFGDNDGDCALTTMHECIILHSNNGECSKNLEGNHGNFSC
jgi:hypothetical protein